MLLASFLRPGVVLAQQPVVTPLPAAVIVEWTTESEVNHAGFNLYRSDNSDGPYIKLNDTLIPASLDPIAGGSYVYTDTTATAGLTYYYKLEDVELDGGTTMHGPVEAVAEADVGRQGTGPTAIMAMVVLTCVLVIVVLIVMRGRKSRRSTSGS
jgi:hypothetical protein